MTSQGPVRAGVYARRSKGDEGDALSRSVQDQIQDCRKFAGHLGWEIVEIYPEDATSAWKKRMVTLPDGRRVKRNVRPVWQKLLDDLYHRRIDALVAYDLDRSMREPRDLEDLIEIAEQLHRPVTSVTGSLRLSNDTEILASRIGVAVANKSSRDTSRRVSRAALRRAENGEWHGGRVAPPGYQLIQGESGKFVGLDLHPEQAPLLREAARRLLKGESLYAICNDWNSRGFTTGEGARWQSFTLRRAMLSPTSIAKRSHKDAPGQLFDTTWPELLDRQTWDRLQILLTDPKRKFGPMDGSYAGKRALGGGVTVCAMCEKKLVSQKHRGKVRLMCHKQATGGCGRVLIAYEPMERFVLDMVLVRLDSPEFHAELASRGTDTDSEEQALGDELDDLDQQRRRVGDAVVAGAYTKADAEAKVKELNEQQERIREKLARLTADLIMADVQSSDDALKLWESADVSRRRRFIQSLVTEVRVKRHPEGVATTLTRRRGETDEQLEERRDEHERAILRQRVDIRWRR